MIKRIVMKDNRYFATYVYFTKYIAENGNAMCVADNEIVEPSAGNDVYRKLKARGARYTTYCVYANNNYIDDVAIRADILK